MPGFWVRFFITACGLLLAAYLLEGVHLGGAMSLLFAALVLCAVNAIV
ncbi:MAG: phage holin family protein, partial [Proteobacteria bacterium]|nr:phage holin family protein [Pseudomonadota bacterium]